jgi:hypothetical protein
MVKAGMICPFSNNACTECALYRGRHLYLCFSKDHRRSKWDMPGHSTAAFPEARVESDKTFGMPTDISVFSTVISDVEDRIEEEEFSRLKKKGEEHDT